MPPKPQAAAAPATLPMTFDPTNPFIVQGDRSVLVEVDNPKYAEARDALAPFAELEKSPEHIHTYRISNLSLWNAAAAGFTAPEVLAVLQKYTKFPIPQNLPLDITETVARYGRVKLQRVDEKTLKLVCADRPLMAELLRQKKLKEYLGEKIDDVSVSVEPAYRGVLKQALIVLGYPAEDLAGYTEGANLPMKLRETCASGVPFHVRDYQREAADVFHAGGDVRGGSGVVVLPCGAGKTVVGVAAMCLLQKNTLVLTTSITAVKQWRREILDKSTLTEDEVKEYTGDTKEIGPVTVATYQIITYRPDKTEEFPHFGLFDKRDWGLIVYDEVHLLPAPVFRVTATIQARRRLGLTATLIREDGREGDVFSLIGPKKYDVPWRELETKGWIASACCSEIRVALPDDPTRMAYAVADHRAKYRIASENEAKDDVVAELLARYHDQRVIIIGQYLTQLRRMSDRFEIPIITGSTGNAEREELYNKFRSGEVRHLVLSKVGNFAIDLPDANVLIQVSGTFGSRQEEAQRLGRILRPKSSGDGDAHFYTLVTRDTRELDFAHHRQMFLTEQGYSYAILDEREVVPPKSAAG
ncbi:type iii restriction protein res subunit : DNA/RNA helicase, superfamily II OS=Singulisphaera acidiphila (strain ATCC BAA-1392 / DSM 18658 / VKM B-2454 / MOB10) GN=Sinac_6347 PE=4 SV=1: Helicase_C_3: ResIII: Helicase_C [Gemmataceae bacterium]|nr:type iii restriction protein res subunit : DNA/RNA helicase, superfamily II OS=Singulisphaera acidiphila (strain ATCC BAA-1392 / DSM 18658 / VKM B-2454 / MOB10) GN=Sinac_6347 PE=4 SV=1: Helicase_C_3: ResIII: Helicase_C [Gemmataceae bacterium]VTT97263.1 type iii restriction protein res subunit : DNA/RNA helicase, superfamily II OS=Singulisphaera acidiphila (strain ATCC BAA-1392 / DSM 18658 / VKM B-2454 / MOB10) GN=Sinac_6347 PE=4 SV=1: Helicase_C_3: ResIII: Helicase_C [Gemmataceae bacterium]